MRATLAVGALSIAVLAPATAAAQVPLGSPGRTDRIEYVASATTADGFGWDLYRNLAYPCSISGYQTFAIGSAASSRATDLRPLWVRMRGGGVGYFDATGQPRPNANNMTEETLADLTAVVENNGLNQRINADPAGFRDLAVSMCDHDIYNGGDQPDPHNPNLTVDNRSPTSNGLFATKAAIAFAQDRYPTDKTFLHGTSAGSFGGYGVAWSLQLEDRPAAGFVADSGVTNAQYERDVNAQNGACARGDEELAGVAARLHPVIADPDNQADLLVARGDLLAPVFNIWNRDDQLSCGSTQISCTMSDGSVVVIGAMECKMDRIARAISGLPASRHSQTMRVCVRANGAPAGTCGRHVVTDPVGAQNTDPAAPSDYQGAILDWVHQRLGDAPPELEVGLGRSMRLRFVDGKARVRCRAGGVQPRSCRVKLARHRHGARFALARGSGTIGAGDQASTLTVRLTVAGRRWLDRGGPASWTRASVRVRERYTGREGEDRRRVRISADLRGRTAPPGVPRIAIR
jgi:hypothetical protein